MIRFTSHVVALGFGLALAGSALAASPCGSDGGARNNPAFSEPGSCPQTKPAAPPAAAKASGGWTRTPDGRHKWADGNGSVTVGGYVRYDMAVGRNSQ